MKTIVVSFLLSLLYLFFCATDSKGQELQKNKNERIYILFHPSDTLLPQPHIIAFDSNSTIHEISAASCIITDDSVFVVLREDSVICRILESYQIVLADIELMTAKADFFIQMSFRNGLLGFEKKWLEVLIKKTNEPIVLFPWRELFGTE